MSISSTILGEFDREMKTTRSLLELVPDKDAAWKPHPKSYSLGELAAHVANLVNFISISFAAPEYDGSGRPGQRFQTTGELLERFDANVKKARAIIEQASDEEMKQKWTFRYGDRVIVSLSRISAFRSFVMNHHIHHRGQLSVYLRLRDVPLPAMYGPTADSPR